MAVGEYAELVRRGGADAGLGGRASVATDKFEAAAAVSADLRPGDVVVVKASRGLGLEVVAEQLRGEPQSGEQR